MIVGQREVDMRAVPRRDHLREPRRGAAGQREGGSAGGGVDDADVLHEDAAFEAGADGLGEGLLGGEALGIGAGAGEGTACRLGALDLRSEEHTSELQSLMRISYAVFCLKKKNK